VTDISSRAGQAECPIRHSARQKSELELGPEHDFTLVEPSQAPLSKPVTSLSRARARENSERAELGQPLLARARLVYMPYAFLSIPTRLNIILTRFVHTHTICVLTYSNLVLTSLILRTI
jgi:hypothetical protein